jgi:RND family efflux transporter MFP subunit
MNRKRDGLAVAVVFVVTVSLLVMAGGCGREQHAANTVPETVSDVSMIVAHEVSVPEWIEAVGTVQAAQTAQIASQAAGSILEIRAHEGDRVQAGQVLAVIDDAQPRAAVDQASAALDAAQKQAAAADADFALAKITLQRYQQLYDKKSVSPQEFDEVKARFQSAEARREMAQAGQSQASAALTQAKTSLSYTQVRAPFSGVITAKMADAGALASPGSPLFAMEATRSYRLEANVDEGDIHFVRAGQTAAVFIDALGGTQLSGKVAEILPAADPGSRSFLVKVSLPAEPRMRSGLFGRVRFAHGEREALLIPRSAVIERGQLSGVYVADEKQIAELRYVTLGSIFGDQAEVLSGLKEGEMLVATPGQRDLGGKRIAPRP